MYSARRTAALPAVGFPIRTSPDQSLVSGSPTLFAATHVLLRLLSPRHPSCALSSLVISLLSAPSLPREDQGPARLPWLTEGHTDLDTSCLPTSLLACAYAVFKDRKSWWSRSGSNRRHPACKAGALPAELRPHTPMGVAVVGLDRFELSTPRLSSVCSNQLSYRPNPGQKRPKNFQRTGSSPGPSKLNRQSTILTKVASPFDLVVRVLADRGTP